MIDLTKQPSDVLIRPGDADVLRTEMVTLLDEMVTGIDGARLHPVASSASTVTVTTADVGRFFVQTGASTLNLPAAASAGNGFTILVQASGGAVTIDPNGSEQINGASTVVLADGSAAMVTCTGSAWRAIVVAGMSGLGTAASEDVGTAIGDVVQLVNVGGVAGLPAVSGANLTDVGGWTDAAAVATTSGTSVTVATSIPAGVKRAQIWFDSVSTNGVDDMLVQIGTGASPTTSGYVSGSAFAGSDSARLAASTGFVVYSASAGYFMNGAMELFHIGSNRWVSRHSILMDTVNGLTATGGGSVGLAGALGNIVLTSLAGTQTFDGGQVRLTYSTS